MFVLKLSGIQKLLITLFYSLIYDLFYHFLENIFNLTALLLCIYDLMTAYCIIKKIKTYNPR